MPGWRMGRSRCGSALMPYALPLHPDALREWRTLTAGIREQFKSQLAERLIGPRIPASKLRGSSHRTKIKIRSAGLRLVYEEPKRNAACRQADQRRSPCPMADSKPSGTARPLNRIDRAQGTSGTCVAAGDDPRRQDASPRA